LERRYPVFDIKLLKVSDRPMYNVQISMDFDEDENLQHAVILFTPNMNDTGDHYHIPLNKGQMVALRDWLTARLGDTPLSEETSVDQIR
jgi:hypothetical protein